MKNIFKSVVGWLGHFAKMGLRRILAVVALFVLTSFAIWFLSGEEASRESHLYEICGCDNQDRIADVVFVHGLDGDYQSTWHPADKPSDYFPQWLGEDFPEVGVWSFDYPAAKFVAAGHTMPIPSRAKNLLGILQDNELGVERPLIFVTHSLGGLIVKKALEQSAVPNEPWSNVVRNTDAVVFVATPNSGSGFADFLSYLANKYTSATVDELKSSNPYLLELNKSYQRNVKEFGIETLPFAETKPTSGVLVVNEASADPNIPGVPVRTLDHDHITICKPTARNRGVYPGVRNFVAECIATGDEKTEAQASPDIEADLNVKETRYALLTEAEQFGAQTNAIMIGKEMLPVGFIKKSDVNPAFYISGAYICKFKIQKKPEFERISIDQLRVVVHEWEPVPEHAIQAGAFPSETNLYLATIKKPPESMEVSFPAKHFYRVTGYDQSEARAFSPLVIDEASSETIHIRINAMEEGVYLISIEADVSHDLAKDTVQLLSPNRVLFVAETDGV